MKIRTAALLSALAVAIAGCSSDEGATSTDTTAADSTATDADSTATDGGSGTTEGVVAQEPDTSSDEALPDDVAEMLADYDVDAEDGVRAAIMNLDRYEQQRPLTFQGSVRTAEVIFSDGEQEVTVPIPGDLVYVSIAPYLDQTHPCHFHALGGCQGEMVQEDVHVQIVDDAGEVLVDEEATTYANGFVGYWLPKDTNGTVTITQGDLSGVAEFATGDEDATCMTTLQLGA